MKIIYLDCQAGISGDMTVAALIDLGVTLEHIRTELAKLPLPANSCELTTSRTERHHIAALKFDVAVHDHHTHRHYADIDEMIAGSGLSGTTKETSRRIFRCLAEAEAKVHGVPIEEVHFHEVGAVDSIVDIVVTALCLDFLKVERIYASALPLGSGFVETAHGRLPVPAPATAELICGMPVHGNCGAGERVTPTGAAILAAMVDSFATHPSMRLEKSGCGAGGKDFADCPNILRAFLGTIEETPGEEVVEAFCNLDDVSPEIVAYTCELLLEKGALDVWTAQIQMKKGRPGVTLSFLCLPDDAKRLSEILMAETGTLGVRYRRLERFSQSRQIVERNSPFGIVRFKISEYGEKPEYEDCRRIAGEQNIPCREVMRQLQNGVKS